MFNRRENGFIPSDSALQLSPFEGNLHPRRLELSKLGAAPGLQCVEANKAVKVPTMHMMPITTFKKGAISLETFMEHIEKSLLYRHRNKEP